MLTWVAELLRGDLGQCLGALALAGIIWAALTPESYGPDHRAHNREVRRQNRAYTRAATRIQSSWRGRRARLALGAGDE